MPILEIFLLPASCFLLPPLLEAATRIRISRILLMDLSLSDSSVSRYLGIHPDSEPEPPQTRKLNAGRGVSDRTQTITIRKESRAEQPKAEIPKPALVVNANANGSIRSEGSIIRPNHGLNLFSNRKHNLPTPALTCRSKRRTSILNLNHRTRAGADRTQRKVGQRKQSKGKLELGSLNRGSRVKGCDFTLLVQGHKSNLGSTAMPYRGPVPIFPSYILPHAVPYQTPLEIPLGSYFKLPRAPGL
ncbi:hypothetical protein B0H13DRAFT_1878431 [Mycena leptocephala]|nr:hypothetical protein B0H13DRAFT_1878431 [Mycena leptocephala]